ncbi:MAG: hypothetical protein RL215_2427 [Planctomycetota bacterium]
MITLRNTLQLLTLLACCGLAAADAPARQPNADESKSANSSPALADREIDQAVNLVMQADEFRSARRRVLEQITISEDTNQDGFLISSISWFGQKVSAAFTYIGNFFEWLFSKNTAPRRRTTQSPAKDDSFLGSMFSGGWLRDLFGVRVDLARILSFILLFLLVIVLTFIAAVLFRRVEKRRRKASLAEEQTILAEIAAPPGELPASTYEGRARRYAADGNFQLAIRELLLGSMSWVERAGLIRYRKGLTNRDYLRSVWRKQPQRESLLATASSFELIWFGRRTPTEEMFIHCLTGFQGAFREEETESPAA